MPRRSLLLPYLLVATLPRIAAMYHETCAGLSASALTGDGLRSETWAPERSPQLSELQVRQLCAPGLRYAARGTQCYAFECADPHYVIKFFKEKHLSAPTFATTQRLQERLKKRDELFRSIRLAYEELEEETGVAYIHLNPEDQWPWACEFEDPVGRRHEVNLGTLSFYVQQRAPALRELLPELGPDQAKQLLAQLAETFRARLNKGILDGDPAILQNFGWTGQKVIQIDVGRLYSADDIDLEAEWNRFITKLRKELAPLEILHEYIDDILPVMALDVDPTEQRLLTKPSHLSFGVAP